MFAALSENRHLLALKKLLPGFPQTGRTYLVGGAIRDVLLELPPVDFDFTSEHDPTPLARAFAKECGGHWFWLDDQRRQSRVVIADGTFDFAPWRAPALAEDLCRRDFTINAMAFDMTLPLNMANLIDPLGGRDDLSARTLRCAGPGVLADDPLRILKGIRHAVELRLAINPASLTAMQAFAPNLTVMAPERLRLETWKILAAREGCRGIGLLDDCRAGDTLFGSDFHDRVDVVQQNLQRANDLLAELASFNQAVARWLLEPVEQGFERGLLLRWCRVLGATGPEQPLMLAHRWRFSRAALSRIASLHKPTPQAWQELMDLPCQSRPVALWALQYGPDPPDLLLMLGLQQPEEPATVRKCLVPYLAALAELPDSKYMPPLVDGRWLMSELGAEGTQLGALHAELRRAEIDGVVRDADEARRYLARRFPKRC